MSKLIPVSKSKYRVVISEVLPYEKPLFFSNRYFSRLLKYYGVIVNDGCLVATKNNVRGLDEFLKILGGRKEDQKICFQYNISKDRFEKGRQLTIIHPFHQVEMVEFYEKYKMVILDFCQRSNFSIRFPYKIATHQKNIKGFPSYFAEELKPEEKVKDSIKHYFAYKNYQNINGFYDDYRFLRAEKAFTKMYKLDLESCFESINPIFLSRALFNCDVEDSKNSIAEQFCNMQKSYNNSSKGLVIGPEFSRLFAELILQQIDIATEKMLFDKFKYQRINDYVFYRYVDDGFFFYNEDEVKKQFLITYDEILSYYALKRNEGKCKDFIHRPFLENITIGKIKLTQLVDVKFQNRLTTLKGIQKVQNGDVDTPTALDFKSFIKDVRSIIGTHEIKYKDITSFLFGIIQKRLAVLLLDFNNLYKQYTESYYLGEVDRKGEGLKEQYEIDFIDFAKNLMESLFFLYLCDMRMSTSIKLVSIINQLQLFVRGFYLFGNGEKSRKFGKNFINELDQKISDETRFVFMNIKCSDSNQLEVLNLLEAQKMMSPVSKICNSVLEKFLLDKEKFKEKLTFFSAFELIHFIQFDDKFKMINQLLLEWIKKKLKLLSENGKSDAESIFTFMEIMCCPWISVQMKKKWIDDIGFIIDKDALMFFFQKQKRLFIKWNKYHVFEELLNVNSTEVY